MQHWIAISAAAVMMASGCSAADPGDESLLTRAYVVSESSDDLFVIDYASLSVVGTVDTGAGAEPNRNHMAVVTPDGRKVYVAATEQDQIIVVDAVTLTATHRIEVGDRPTHLDLRPGAGELWVVNEASDSISVIDTGSDQVRHTIRDDSFMVPHFVRFTGDAAYVPSIGGNQISVVDLERYRVREVIALGDGPARCAADPCGFADAQIDPDGVLWAAHIQSGTVLAYDTRTQTTLGTVTVGQTPWAVFVAPEDSPGPAMMPNWDDASVSVLASDPVGELARSDAGSRESYGVHVSALVPEHAFVLSRSDQQVNVVDRGSGDLRHTIPLGGTTETAAITADGRYLLLPLSSADALAVVEVTTHDIVARFDDIGRYPWSVTTVGAQNYCH